MISSLSAVHPTRNATGVAPRPVDPPERPAPAMLEHLQAVRVDLGPRSYPIAIGRGMNELPLCLPRVLETTWAGRGSRRAFFITDANVAPLLDHYVPQFEAAGLACRVATVPPGEPSKSIEVAASLYDRLIEDRADRHTLVVALGGGVVGDLAGFVAATFARGLPLFMIPTSLLAQVDSSVGGKVGVNRPGAKNGVGAFHQPIGVWIDVECLATLPPRELRCGLAEVIKYGVILDSSFFDRIERGLDRLLALDETAIIDAVTRSCELKAEVVSADEREETGLRAVLNFGHTVGHAIEAVAGYGGDYLHGEAVAAGMVAECRLAERLGWVDADLTRRLVILLERAGLPTRAPGLDPAALRAAMSSDKKNRSGRVRFVLPRRLGRVELTDLPTDADLAAILDDLVG